MIENNEKIENLHVSLTPEGKSIALSERVLDYCLKRYMYNSHLRANLLV